MRGEPHHREQARRLLRRHEASATPSLEGHAARVGAHAEAVARRLGWTRRAARGAAARRRAPRRRQGQRRARRCSRKPGRARRGGARRDPRAPGRGRVADRRRPVASRAALPYVLFHHERWDGTRLPDAARGARDPARGPAARRRGRVRRDDLRPAVPRRARALDGGGRRGRALRRLAVRPRDRARRSSTRCGAGEIASAPAAVEAQLGPASSAPRGRPDLELRLGCGGSPRR